MNRDHESSKGYSAETPYIYAYFRQQHPAMMHWQLLLQGYCIPEDIQSLPHLELGFGQGLGLSLTAVSRQTEEYVGVDFIPEHSIALEQRCDGIAPNLILYPTDFRSFLAQNTQSYQSISLHGVWSWVNPEIRDQLLDIFRLCLAKGGIVYLSHNTLPARAPVLPLQRLLYLTGKVSQADEITALSTAFSTLAQALPQSRYAQDYPNLAHWWEEVSQANPSYLIHEYMSSAWFPLLFADTAQLLSQAGLDYLCSADTTESLQNLHLTEEQQAWLSQFEDYPELKESYSDLLRNTAFRRDLWGKGRLHLSEGERVSRLLKTRLTLIQPVGALPLSLKGDLGEFELPEAIYWAVLSLFEQHSVMIGETLLEELNQYEEGSFEITEFQLVEVLEILTAIGYLHPAQSPQAIQQAIVPCQLLNQRLCEQAWTSSSIHYLASPVAGCGIQVSPWQMLCLLARSATKTEEVEVWMDWLLQHPQARALHLMAQIDQLTQIARNFSQQRLLLLKRLWIVNEFSVNVRV